MVSEIILLCIPFSNPKTPRHELSCVSPLKALLSPAWGLHSLLTHFIGVLEECGPDSSLLNRDPHVFCIGNQLRIFIWGQGHGHSIWFPYWESHFSTDHWRPAVSVSVCVVCCLCLSCFCFSGASESVAVIVKG